MVESEHLWAARIERCFGAVRAWSLRITAPDEVEAGSSLAGDDKDLRWTGHLFDELAWWGGALKAAR